MPSVSPFLWFSEKADEALELYTKVFADSEVLNVERAPTEGHEQFMAGTIRIGGTEIIIFNGGPYAQFAFNPSFSLFVVCDDQVEVDRYWYGLSENGAPGQCGWLTDPFGVSWQIVPRLFTELMRDPDQEKTGRLFEAMMKMTRLDSAKLRAAFDGT